MPSEDDQSAWHYQAGSPSPREADPGPGRTRPGPGHLRGADRLAEPRTHVEDPSSQLQVELVAADRKVWEGEANMVIARTVDGELGILSGHTPLLGVLVEGEVRIKTDGATHTASLDSGFLG